MRDPKKKCIAKKCEDCNFWQVWDMTETKTGIKKQTSKCSFQVLCEEIPFIRGSIDGCQQSTNETRNKVFEFGHASIETLEQIKNNTNLLR